ncbi:MAG: hypothetical protein Q4G71_00740 [Pseudomonadota bacterium]|nr:hypothetical protein [Pseudomonadota bacterium]
MSLAPHAARRLVLPVLLALVSALAACGGDVSWCFGGGDSGVSAGYNTDQCPPDAADRKGLDAPDAPDMPPTAASPVSHDV